MSGTNKRPRGLAASRIAKRQKQNDAATSSSTALPESDERKVTSTGDVLEDLQQMLRTALTTGDAAWYRAVIHEAERILGIIERDETLEGALTLDPHQIMHVAMLYEGRALVGLGVLISESDEETPKEGEPEELEEWLSAAETLLGYVDDTADLLPDSSYLGGYIVAHRIRLGTSQKDETLEDVVASFDRMDDFLKEQPTRPIDFLQMVFLVISLCERDPEADQTGEALAWAKKALTGMAASAGRDYALADCLLLSSSRIAEEIEGEGDGEDWTLPDTPEVRGAREDAETAASLLLAMMTAASAEERDELKAKLGEALLTQANLTADETAREALYKEVEAKAGVKLDAE